MLRLLRHLLYHFRWPVLAALLTVPLLAFLFQPHPVAEYQIPDDPKNPYGYREQLLVSPSGAYLVLFEDFSGDANVYQMNNMKLLFKARCINKSTCGFDDLDGLAFATYGSDNGGQDDSIVEWWHWEPGELTPQKLGSRSAFPAGLTHSDSWYGDRFNGLKTLGESRTINGLLSPDAKTWLFPSQNETTFHFDLIDAKSGKERARLERADINSKKSETTSIEVMFTPDSQQLLAQTINFDEKGFNSKERCHLESFDAHSGKLIATRKLPEDVKLGHLLQFDQGHLIAMQTETNALSMQQLSKENGYQNSLLPETIPEPIVSTLGKDSNALWVANLELAPHIHSIAGKVVYSWEHVFLPKTGGIGGQPPHLPGFHYAVRDIATGKLIHTETLTTPSPKDNEYQRSGWNWLAVLPDHSLLLQEPSREIVPWQKTIEEWREKYCNWLPALFHQNTRLQLIEATTGNRLVNLSLNSDVESTLYHPQQNALYLSCRTKDDHCFIQKYAYPLHKPWLTIISWSAAVLALLAAIQCLFALLRYPFKKKLT